MAGAPEGWYSDPTGQYSNRYWDGARWTDSVSRGGANHIDPAGAPANLSPPAPGTSARGTSSAPQSIVVTNDGGRKSGGTFMGFVFGAVAIIFGFIIVIYAINANDDDGGGGENTPTTEPAADGGGSEDGG